MESTEQVFVGFEDEATKIMDYLFRDSKKLDVLSIVGMPGLGKTTLAKKLYGDPSIKNHFDVRVWCSISQIYHKREVLITLLGDVIEITEAIKMLNDEELAAKLYQSLKGRRYLILIDDLWDVDTWCDLKRSFPNDNSHSRILITTRIENLATKVGNKVHLLRQFSDSESWELFQKKLKLENEIFSQEFMVVGKQIVDKCKGLPLTIVMASGLLAKSKKNIDLWRKIAGSLSFSIFRDLGDLGTRCKAILELSYIELPDPLKSCFLYIGAFPEDAEISTWKLKSLWIAEGFVRNSGEKSLEDVAEEYLMDLISRSLVTVSKERSHGGVKACGIHDILRDFCLEKAKTESYLQVVNKVNLSGTLVEYDQRRLSFYCCMDDLIEANPSFWNVRSLFISNIHTNQMPFISQNFGLLRVLDLLYLRIKRHYFEEVTSLIHLRYLGYMSSRIGHIPSSIGKLTNLQHLHVGYYYGSFNYTKIDSSLWRLANLRNVKIGIRFDFIIDESKFDVNDDNFMHNLETLSTPYFWSAEQAENVLRRLPKLWKLKCCFDYDWGKAHGYSEAVNLTFLHQLMSLNVDFGGPKADCVVKCRLNLPSNLQKLTLSGYGKYWDEVSIIGRSLPNLKVLKVTDRIEDMTWIVNVGDFPKLKYLKLCCQWFLKEWIASDDSFPILEQLVLEYCPCLTAILPCFEGMPIMRMITVRKCSPSVDASAMRIQMEQHEEWQNEELQVSIYPLNI